MSTEKVYKQVKQSEVKDTYNTKQLEKQAQSILKANTPKEPA